LRHPEHAAVIARVLSIPPKRFEKRTVTFLTAQEAKALIDAPDLTRWERRPRPRAAHPRDPRRTARLGADRPELRRHRARHRRARPLRGQRPQATRGPAHRPRPGRPGHLAHRTSGPTTRPAVPDTYRPATQTQGSSDTPTSAPPSPTSTPTSRSRSEPSRSSPRPTSSPAATSHPTPSSPSATACDYADTHAASQADKHRWRSSFAVLEQHRLSREALGFRAIRQRAAALALCHKRVRLRP